MNTIMTSALKVSDIPIGRINWEKFSDFALTFDPILENLSDQELRTISKMAPLQSHNIRELRGFLYNFQRIWNHRSDDPDRRTWETVLEVIEWVRNKVAAQSKAPGQ